MKHKPTRGQVLIGDWDTREHSVAKMASRVGYVFQNPDEQLFSRTVGAEVAFGPKNLGYDAERVQALVHDALAATVEDAFRRQLGVNKRAILLISEDLDEIRSWVAAGRSNVFVAPNFSIGAVLSIGVVYCLLASLLLLPALLGGWQGPGGRP